ncbi:MAG: TVP38/TMEM64 family protein [Promethearchaeota archaeon]|jgi:uncharacterized membrane protein YdjX (TVP38/TMEM64 family)
MQENTNDESFSIKFKKYVRNLFNFSQYSIKTILFVILFVALVVLSLAILIYNYFFDTTFVYRIVAEWFVNPIWASGYLGILLFIGIMAIQGLIVPIPSEVVLLATGMIWGWLFGGIMGIIGSMAASLLCFYISRRGGRPLAQKFVGESGLAMADRLIQKYGVKAIIVSRFIPFISFDVISYASGLVDIDIKKYSIGTLIGSIFRAFFYSVWGALLGFTPPIDTTDVGLIRAQSEVFNVILLVVLAILVVMFLLYYLISKFYEKKSEKTEK